MTLATAALPDTLVPPEAVLARPVSTNIETLRLDPRSGRTSGCGPGWRPRTTTATLASGSS